MTNVFKGRHFLAEKDFTRAELEWLIDFSAHLKDLKNAIFHTVIWKVKILPSCLKNINTYSCCLHSSIY